MDKFDKYYYLYNQIQNGQILSENDYIELVKINGLALSYIPDKNKTFKICCISIKNNVAAITYVPKIYYKKLCKQAVILCGIALKYIKPKYRTVELCKIAIQNDSYALQYVPTKYKKLI